MEAHTNAENFQSFSERIKEKRYGGIKQWQDFHSADVRHPPANKPIGANYRDMQPKYLMTMWPRFVMWGLLVCSHNCCVKPKLTGANVYKREPWFRLRSGLAGLKQPLNLIQEKNITTVFDEKQQRNAKVYKDLSRPGLYYSVSLLQQSNLPFMPSSDCFTTCFICSRPAWKG